jgi:hypothetical protein
MADDGDGDDDDSDDGPAPPGLAAFLQSIAGLAGAGGALATHVMANLADEVAFQDMAAAQARVARLGAGAPLPPELLLEDRDFDEDDYEALLALDAGVAPRGLDQAAIERLPTVTLPRGGGPAPDGETRCPICHEDYKAGDVLRCTPCMHYFHAGGCLDEWLGRRPTCPVCVTKVAPQ